MYILINASIGSELKKQISEKIDDNTITKWKFIVEEDKRRLIYIDSGEYDDVVLRFIITYIDGEQFVKILPTPKLGVNDIKLAQSHFGNVLGRFAELLNCFFLEISYYQTVLD